MISRATSLGSAVAIGLGLALSACGAADDDASADPSETSSASASESPTEITETAETPTEDPSTPAVAPATGPELAVEGLRVNAPEGWEAKPPYAVMAAAFPVGVIGTTVYVFRFPNAGLALDEVAAASRRQSDWQFTLERLDDVELDGLPAFHLAGRVNPGQYIEKFGAIVDDERLTVNFEFLNGEDRATRDEIIDSVLATVDFAA